MNTFPFLRRVPFLGLLIVMATVFAGCGYSTRSALPSNLRYIYIEPFKNRVNFTDANRRNVYFPLLEVDVRNAVVDRFVFDGSMRIAEPQDADVILKGELTNYERHVLRYVDNTNNIQEYRVQIVVNLTMMDVARNEPLWTETGFTGQADYFVTGPLASSEEEAIRLAMKDLAQRIVERMVENW